MTSGAGTLAARTSRRRRRFRIARRTAAVLVLLLVLAALGVFGARWRASSIITRMLRSFAVAQVAAQSGGAYRLDIGDIRFTWSLRRFRVDSALLTTDSALNARRARPLTALRLVMRRCTVSGVSLHRLVLSRGIYATRLGCGDVEVSAHVPHQPASVAISSGDTLEALVGRRVGFLVLQQQLVMPSFAPRIHVRQVSFPKLSLLLTRPGSRGGESRVELQRLAWSVTGLTIDPGDGAAAARPLFSHSIEIVGENLELHPDSASRLTVGRLRISLTDATVELREVSWEPTLGDAEYAGASRWRRDPIRLRVARVAAAGLDTRGLASGLATRARKVVLDSLDVRLYSDKRIPKHPSGLRHRTPQQWIAGLEALIHVDSVVFTDARFIYRERRRGYDRPALLTFTDVQATATNASHRPGRVTTQRVDTAMTGPDVLILETSSILESAARLRLTFRIPLDAERFGMTFSGSLGPMPATALNPLIETTQPVRIGGGDIEGVRLLGVVRDGVASGFVTPRYQGLSMSVTGQGRGGLVRSGGLLGSAARSLATMSLMGRIRRHNPEREGLAPVSGHIRHTFSQAETLPAFLWRSTRGGLEQVVLK